MIRRFFQLLGTAVLIQACALPVFADERLPVPTGAELDAALQLVREVFSVQYAEAKTDSQKQSLAKKMVSTAGDTPEPKNRYALLHVARQIATQAGDGLTAFNAIDEMDRMFAVDALQLKGNVLHALSAAPKFGRPGLSGSGCPAIG